jgi:hypothetical protein
MTDFEAHQGLLSGDRSLRSSSSRQTAILKSEVHYVMGIELSPWPLPT